MPGIDFRKERTDQISCSANSDHRQGAGDALRGRSIKLTDFFCENAMFCKVNETYFMKAKDIFCNKRIIVPAGVCNFLITQIYCSESCISCTDWN